MEINEGMKLEGTGDSDCVVKDDGAELGSKGTFEEMVMPKLFCGDVQVPLEMQVSAQSNAAQHSGSPMCTDQPMKQEGYQTVGASSNDLVEQALACVGEKSRTEDAEGDCNELGTVAVKEEEFPLFPPGNTVGADSNAKDATSVCDAPGQVSGTGEWQETCRGSAGELVKEEVTETLTSGQGLVCDQEMNGHSPENITTQIVVTREANLSVAEAVKIDTINNESSASNEITFMVHNKESSLDEEADGVETTTCNAIKAGDTVSDAVDAEQCICKECGQTFPSALKLKLHAASHKHNLTCFFCNLKLSSRKGLKRHLAIHDGNTNTCTCPVCDLVMTNRSSLKRHMDSHAGVKRKKKVRQAAIRLRIKAVRYTQLKESSTSKKGRLKKLSYSDSSETDEYNTESVQVATNSNEDADEGEVLPGKQKLRKMRKRKAKKPEGPVANKMHECIECGKACRTKHHLREHEKTHSGLNKTHKCPECGKLCSTEFNLQEHISAHNRPKPSCTECGAVLNTRSSLRRHMKIHTGEKDHSAKRMCQECGITVANGSSLRRHMMTHSTVRPFKCLECDKGFTTQDYLNRHIRADVSALGHGSQGRTSSLHQDEGYAVQYWVHSGDKPHTCPVCETKFYTETNLAAHMRRHTGEEPYQCATCGKTFTTHTGLKRHEKGHAENLPYQCNVCERAFTTNSRLTRHKMVHTGERPFCCATCGLRFTRGHHLSRHMLLHQGIKVPRQKRPHNHMCEVCGLKRESPAALRLHMRIHTGEKPFQCSQCPIRFAVKSNLLRHEREHQGIKPFTCPVCRKTFARNGTLNRHMWGHVQTRPFKCSTCGGTFAARYRLYRHMKRVHGISTKDKDDTVETICDISLLASLVDPNNPPPANPEPDGEAGVTTPPLPKKRRSHSKPPPVPVSSSVDSSLPHPGTSCMEAEQPEPVAPMPYPSHMVDMLGPASTEASSCHTPQEVPMYDTPTSSQGLSQVYANFTFNPTPQTDQTSTAAYMQPRYMNHTASRETAGQPHLVATGLHPQAINPFGFNPPQTEPLSLLVSQAYDPLTTQEHDPMKLYLQRQDHSGWDNAALEQKDSFPNQQTDYDTVRAGQYSDGGAESDHDQDIGVEPPSSPEEETTVNVHHTKTIPPKSRRSSKKTAIKEPHRYKPVHDAPEENDTSSSHKDTFNSIGIERRPLYQSLNPKAGMTRMKGGGAAGSKHIDSGEGSTSDQQAASLTKEPDQGDLDDEEEEQTKGIDQNADIRPTPLFDPDPGPHICMLCNQELGTDAKLREHITQHMKSDQQPSEDNSEDMNKALQFIFKPKEKTVPCPDCNKKFVHQNSLQVHKSLYHSDGEFKCIQCSKRFATAKGLSVHISSHSGKSTHKCGHCDQTFPTSDRRERHEKLHTNETFCEVCGRGFTLKKKYDEHMRRHAGAKPFVCPQCGLNVSSENSLRRHFLNKHTHFGMARNYMCEFCAKKFESKAALKIHTRLHTGEKPYACDQCEMKFAKKSNLETHRRVHSPDKPHVCDICGKAFKRGDTLNLHMKNHTGEKLFYCEKCGKGFATKYRRKRHYIFHDKQEKAGAFACSPPRDQLHMPQHHHLTDVFAKPDSLGPGQDMMMHSQGYYLHSHAEIAIPADTA